MTEYGWIPILFVVLITVATVGMGLYATRKAKGAADFFVAGRSVSVMSNASAISGEYLSAASFMGVAALVMKNGYDALWYPIGYAAGYLFLLLFIAGPLRRFGAYTIPDFAEGRFDSPKFRRTAVLFVLLIGFFYTMPQMKGAGTVMVSILGWPYWLGILVVGSVITLNVALGGMKGITFVQAFQYWAKLFAISVPIFILMGVYGSYTETMNTMHQDLTTIPNILHDSPIVMKGKKDAPLNVMSLSPMRAIYLYITDAAVLDKISPSKKIKGSDPMPEGVIQAADVPDRMQYDSRAARYEKLMTQPDGSILLPAHRMIRINPYRVTSNGVPVTKDSKPVRNSVKLEFRDETKVFIPIGAVAMNAPTNGAWMHPFGPLTSKEGYIPLLYTYSLIIALVCGTAGLPHILVRFYTNPDGKAAKQTTLAVMVMLGIFYVCTPIWGTLARAYMPVLYANNSTDNAVIKLPMYMDNHLVAAILIGITSAGAFAAFMSTFSGLLVSMSGAVAHDIYGKMIKPTATDAERMQMFKYAAVGIGTVSMLLGFAAKDFDIAKMVGWAFAIGAASYFPLLLLGSWWRGLTRQGATAGMLIGGLLSLSAIVSFMLIEKKILHLQLHPLMLMFMEQPAIWAVPLSLLIMVFVSKATAKDIPADATLKMLRLHAPEEMGFSKNYIEH